MSRLADAIRWLEVRLNRPLLPSPPDRAFWSLYQSGGAVLEQAPPTLEVARGLQPDLLIGLTTYNRPESCDRILAALPELCTRAGRPLTVHVVVVKDAGGAGYDSVLQRVRDRLGDRLTWLDAREPLGKQGYWKTYQILLLTARQLHPAHMLFLQDDVEFSGTLLADCYALFEGLASDPRRRVLYLCSAADDEAEGRWVRFRRREVNDRVRLTQWFDLSAFFVDRAMLDLLRYRMIPVPQRRWRSKPYSSGVGEQLTRRLFRHGNVYQAMPSLVFHGGHPSEMNPEARVTRALDNRPPAPGLPG